MRDLKLTRAEFLKMLAACGVGAGISSAWPAHGAETTTVSDAEGQSGGLYDCIVIDGLVSPRRAGDGNWPRVQGEIKRLAGIDAGCWDVVDLANLENIDKLVQAYGHSVMRIDRADDVGIARASGRLGLLYYAARQWKLAGSREPLARWHAHGLRALQIAYDGDNELGGGVERPQTRLTPFGKEVVAELNRLKMVIDVSRCGRLTTLDVASASTQPITASHANALALTAVPRNKSDEEIKAIAATGGVMAVTNNARCLRRTAGGSAGIADFVAHVDYIVQLVGIDHVGFSSESWIDGEPTYSYDRTDTQLNGWERWSHVAAALRGKGYVEGDVRKLLGLNFLRVYREVLG